MDGFLMKPLDRERLAEVARRRAIGQRCGIRSLRVTRFRGTAIATAAAAPPPRPGGSRPS